MQGYDAFVHNLILYEYIHRPWTIGPAMQLDSSGKVLVLVKGLPYR